jgi:hypothetical protein
MPAQQGQAPGMMGRQQQFMPMQQQIQQMIQPQQGQTTPMMGSWDLAAQQGAGSPLNQPGVQNLQRQMAMQQGLFQGPPNAPGQMSPFGQSPLGMFGQQILGQQQGSPYGPNNTSMIGQMPGVNPQSLFSALSFMRGLPGMGFGGQQPFGQMGLPQQFQGPQRYAFKAR